VAVAEAVAVAVAVPAGTTTLAGAVALAAGAPIELAHLPDAVRRERATTPPAPATSAPTPTPPSSPLDPEDAALRERLVALAAQLGTTLVIDETIGGLELDGQQPEPPLATLGRAVLLGSVGKSVWGGLRIGWIRADRELIQRLARARYASDLGTPILEQLIVLDLLPQYDEILDERRTLLREGRDRLRGLLAARIPDWRVPNPEGGLTLWVELGAPVSSQLAIAARNEGLVIAAGPRFGMNGVFERFLRVPFSHPPQLIDRAVDALAAAWAAVTRHPVVIGQEDLADVV